MELFPYQDYGADWLSQKRFALLADEMRVGKSPQSVTACDRVNANLINVICPASARENWAREFSKWSMFSHNTKCLFTGEDRPLRTTGLNVVSYDLAIQLDTLKSLSQTRPDVLILDESHYLKSTTAQRTHAVWGLHGLARKSKRIWCLTGTPMPNGQPHELWVMLHSFGVYRGKYDSFVRRFCTGYWDGNTFMPTGVKNEAALNELLSQVMLRRTMAEVRPELPETIYTDVVLDSAQLPVEDRIQDDHVRAVLENTPLHKRAEVLADLSNKSLATLRRHTGLAKVPAAAEYLRDELRGGVKKMVVFAWHTEVIDKLRARLFPREPIVIDGRVPSRKRQPLIDEFHRSSKRKVLIGQIGATKENLDFTPADDIYFVESSWVPGDNLQASKRCSNVYKMAPVTARFLALPNSSDELVQRAQIRKLATIDKVIG